MRAASPRGALAEAQWAYESAMRSEAVDSVPRLVPGVTPSEEPRRKSVPRAAAGDSQQVAALAEA